MRSWTQFAAAFLVVGALTFPVAHAQSPAQVSGRVTEAGTRKSLPGVRVTTTPSPPRGGATAARVVTDENGDFNISGLETGRFSLTLDLPGYVVTTRYAVVLNVRNDATTHRDFEMTRTSTISGVVESPERVALAGVPVELVQAVHYPQGAYALRRKEVRSDRDGAFAFTGVIPATYFVRTRVARDPVALGNEDTGYLLDAYYPNAGTIEGAVPLAVAAGTDEPGLRIRLGRSPHFRIQGEFRGPAAPEGSRTRITLARSTFPGSMTEDIASGQLFAFGAPDGVDLSPDGVFAFEDVPPGRYIVKVQSSGGGTRAPVVIAGAPVEVVDRDVDRLVLTAIRRGAISGKIVFEDGNLPDPGKPFTLTGSNPVLGLSVTPLIVAPDGRFEADQAAGLLRLGASGATTAGFKSQPLVVTKIEVLGQTTEGSVFEFPGSDATVVFTVSTDRAVLEGKVKKPQGVERMSGVVSISRVPANALTPVNRVVVKEDGSFLLQGLETGRHRVCAWSGDLGIDELSGLLFDLNHEPQLARDCKTVELKLRDSKTIELDRQISPALFW